MPLDTTNAPLVSIIICTCNRADSLAQTLESLARLQIPEDMPTELLVVDNASTDRTAEVVHACRLPNMPVRYLSEPRRGKGYAYNSGMAAASGAIFLFTDDDVQPPIDWIERMCRPILLGGTDAVSGGIRLAPSLHRPWMTPEHVGWLASTEFLPPDTQIALIGANMAFRRQVLDRVPMFDIEVGPGAKGHADDTLFSFQLTQAGYRTQTALDIVVEHHLGESRLSRKSFGAQAKKRGEFNAYVRHHWRHETPRHPRLRLVRTFILLWLGRLKHLPEWAFSRTIPAWELSLLEEFHSERCFLQEMKSLRNYAPLGLTKLEQQEKLGRA